MIQFNKNDFSPNLFETKKKDLDNINNYDLNLFTLFKSSSEQDAHKEKKEPKKKNKGNFVNSVFSNDNSSGLFSSKNNIFNSNKNDSKYDSNVFDEEGKIKSNLLLFNNDKNKKKIKRK